MTSTIKMPTIPVITKTDNGVAYRKQGNVVIADMPSFAAGTIAAWGSKNISSIPAGFSPSETRNFYIPRQNRSSSPSVFYEVSSSGKLKIQSQSGNEIDVGNVMRTTLTWMVD